MRARSRLARGLVSLPILAVSLGACGRGPEPTGPTSARPNEVVRVDIVGPGAPIAHLDTSSTYRVAPGQTAQFRALAKLADGTIQDFTSDAKWSSSNVDFLSSAGAGFFTGHNAGSATIRAENPRFNNIPLSREVLILAPDTYVLAGDVIESREPLATMDGARVTVMSGPARGQVSVTQICCGYRLFGLTGPTALRITKDGYRTQDLIVVVSDHQRFDVDLAKP